MPESANDRYERRAEAFYRATGMMAPGKDVPAAFGVDDYEARSAAWVKWCAENPDTPAGEATGGEPTRCTKCGSHFCRPGRCLDDVRPALPSPASAGAAPGQPVSNAEELPASSVSGTGEGEPYPECMEDADDEMTRDELRILVRSLRRMEADARRRLSELEAERGLASFKANTERNSAEHWFARVTELEDERDQRMPTAEAIAHVGSLRELLATAERRIGELDAEQRDIGEVCLAAGVQTTDGTAYAAVRDLADSLADSRRQLQAVQQEVEKARERLGHGVGANMGKITHEVYEPWCPRCILDRAAARVHPQEGASRGE